MSLELANSALTVASGALVGLILTLVGGGGSILAVPLMVYVLAVPDAHQAIGTSAIAVGLSAAAGLPKYALAGQVKWRCAGLFAAIGVIGAWLGSTLSMALDARKLLGAFALMMVLAGIFMLKKRCVPGNPDADCGREQLPRLLGFGGAAGTFSGFFGIGGGFLIVPSLVAATGMPTLHAIGSSLVAVAAFGLTTGLNYARTGQVNWRLALLFVAGGIAGGSIGTHVARRLSNRKGTLETLLATLTFLVAAFMVWQSVRPAAAP
ncbi:MAG: sulfite exporter TauE/SafE family protein [Pseudomonadota bacterium]|nr:sulfite exporter TauE/SafE family protein [Pseudomonadota bacterium]